MKIGDLAERTGTPTRMLRYYEAQGLLEPERGANGYRLYSERDVDRVRRIRNHVAAGLPTRLVRVVFDMEKPAWTQACSAEFAELLSQELTAIDEKIACLTASRETIRDFLTNARVAST
jgi:DNA-binding transcriptional MerR regulator